jgi:parallel beta-helix repeat protein
VKHGRFEGNEIRGNQKAGISIGHKDTDNLFRNNTVVGNSLTGVLFRNESEAMGAHRNVFENNRVLDNGGERGSKSAAILIEGHHHDLVFRNNTIGNSQAGGKTAIGVVASEGAKNLKADKNEFVNVEKQIEGGK